METHHPEASTAALTMSLGAKPRLQFLCQWFAVFMGLSSIGAALPVAALSFGGYAAAKLLGKIRPLREGYEFLSRAYDQILDRVGQRVLRDPRDLPALRLMVSLTLTVVPIFAIQIVLRTPRLLLVIAFYLSLYGLKFQRFVRMFSASHLEAHRRSGFFSEKYNRVFGRYLEFFLGYFYGNLPELGRTAHVCLHHKENAGFDDTRNTMAYDPTDSISYGISRATFGQSSDSLPTPTLKREVTKRTGDGCYEEWLATTLTSQLSSFTTGELGCCMRWFPFSV